MAKAMKKSERQQTLDAYYEDLKQRCQLLGVRLQASVPLYSDAEYYVITSDLSGRYTSYGCPSYDIGAIVDAGIKPQTQARRMRHHLDTVLASEAKLKKSK